jgi:serine protease Do
MVMTAGHMASASVFAPMPFADLAAQVGPAVVNIASIHHVVGGASLDQGSDQQNNRGVEYLGSGFIIDPSGYIVTNNHVVADADVIEVTINTGRIFQAQLIGADKKTDLALLKIDSSGPLPFVSFGNSDSARLGDPVLAVGNPFGLGGTATAGIISGLGRDLHAGPYDDYMQIDAPINPGNSGGPTFNLLGQVIGNTSIASPSGGSVGIGFAIPANMARPIVQELRLHGQVVRGWIGVTAQEVTADLAESLDLGRPTGALLASIQPGSPAAMAKLRQGDVILSFGGHQVETTRALRRFVAGESEGKRVYVVLWRDGSQETVSLTIASIAHKPRSDLANNTSDKVEHLLDGVRLASLTKDLRRRLALPDDATGVVVLIMAETSLAAREGLEQGDVIEQVEEQYVNSPVKVDRLVEQAAATGHAAALILVNRAGHEFYLAAKVASGNRARRGAGTRSAAGPTADVSPRLRPFS